MWARQTLCWALPLLSQKVLILSGGRFGTHRPGVTIRKESHGDSGCGIGGSRGQAHPWITQTWHRLKGGSGGYSVTWAERVKKKSEAGMQKDGGQAGVK